MNTSISRALHVFLSGAALTLPCIAHPDTAPPLSPILEQAVLPELPSAQLFEEARQQIRQQQLPTGIKTLEQASAQGNAEAAFELASYHELGLGVPKDYQQAKHYYEQAIRQGHRDAHFNLALLLIKSDAPFHDMAQARTLMEAIARRNDAEAQYTLALMLNDRLGNAATDPVQALYWTRAAAKHGHASAQYALGTRYLKGEGVAQNSPEAFTWLQKAAAQQIAGAQFNLALMYENGDGVAANLPQALSWYESAARLGNINAQQNLGIKYLLGEQVKPDPAKAMQLITLAAKAGQRDSQFLLGNLYESGYQEAVSIDTAQAEQWYLRAAQQGHVEAQYQLALLLSKQPTRSADAHFWVTQAVAAGHKAAKDLQAHL